MDVESGLLENFLSTVASSFRHCLTKSGEVDLRILPTSWLKLIPQVEAVPIIPIRSGEDVSTIPMTLPLSPVVLLSTPFLLTHHRFMDIHVMTNAVSAMISFVAGVRSVYVVNVIVAIPGFVGIVKTGMVRKLNNFCSKSR